MCVCILALGNRQAQHLISIILSSVACLAIIFFHVSHKQYNFLRKFIEHKMYVLISTTFLWNISHSTKNAARYYHKCRGLQIKYPLLSYFNETSFWQIFENSSNIKFHKNPSRGSWVVPRRKTDRHDIANGRFLQFCECT